MNYRIAFCGEKGSGKDTGGNYVAPKYELTPISIIRPIRILQEQVYGPALGIMPSDKEANRPWLQEAGEVLYREYGEFLLGGMAWKFGLGDLSSPDGFVVTDLRHPWEADFLRRLGFFIVRVVNTNEEQRKGWLIKRDGGINPETANHVSETNIQLIAHDVIVYNGTDDLGNEVSQDDFFRRIDAAIEHKYVLAPAERGAA